MLMLMRLLITLLLWVNLLPAADSALPVYDVSLDVKAPELVRVTRPELTPEARAVGAEGRVRMSLIVDDLGQPQQVQVIEGLGFGLDEAAAKAVAQWRFRPAMKDGKPVWVRLRMSVKFVRDSAD